MPVTVVDPCQRRLEQDVASGPFEAGAAAGLWRAIAVDWPILMVGITAGDGGELVMRLRVDGYPRQAPSGEPWDQTANAPLPTAQWPSGGTAPQIFRIDWSVGNGNAPYMACDRIGLTTHPDWASQHPDRAWHPGRTIAFYVQEIHQELRSATLPAATS